MNMRCATVKICDGNDSYVVINESDFDSKKHEIFSEDKKPAKKADKKEGKVK